MDVGIFELASFVLSAVLGFVAGRFSNFKASVKLVKEGADVFSALLQAAEDMSISKEEAEKVYKEFKEFRAELKKAKK